MSSRDCSFFSSGFLDLSDFFVDFFAALDFVYVFLAWDTVVFLWVWFFFTAFVVFDYLDEDTLELIFDFAFEVEFAFTVYVVLELVVYFTSFSAKVWFFGDSAG